MAGENEAGQTLLVAAEGVEGAVEGVEGADCDGEGVMYVTREDGQVNEILADIENRGFVFDQDQDMFDCLSLIYWKQSDLI